MNKTIAFLIVLLLVVLIATASPKVSTYAGIVRLNNSQATYKTLPAEVAYDQGKAVGLEAMFPANDRLSLGLSYDYASADVRWFKVMGFEKAQNDTFEAHTVLLQGVVDLPQVGLWTPYVGAGLGATYSNDVTAAREARIGLKRTVKDSLTVGVELRNRGGSTIEDGNLRVDYPSTKFVGVKLDFNF